MEGSLILSFLKFSLGIAILLKGADLLIDGASNLAKRAGIPEFVIGLTLVAFGTSLPELTVNVSASLKGASEITLGNVIGSNIANILLILGVASLIRPLSVNETFVRKEIPLNFLSILILFAMVSDSIVDGKASSTVSRSEGLVLITTFVGYLYFLAAFLKKEEKDQETYSYGKSLIFTVFGLLGLFLGSELTVRSGIEIASILGVSQVIIGLFLIAVGTSLPELTTSAVAAYRGNSDLALGNVAGSNIFNVSLVLGTSSLIHPIPVPERVFRDLIILFLATLVLFLSNYTGSRYTVSRIEGAIFLLIYVAYALISWYWELLK